MKRTFSFCLLLCAMIFLGKAAFAKAPQSPLVSFLHAKVVETIQHSKEIPGLKGEEFNLQKENIAQTWDMLVQNGVIEVKATDSEIRPCFVALQGIIEHVLSCELQKQIFSLEGIIHTPMPATPLCTTGEISKDLVDPSIEKDPNRLFTVKARTTTIRDFLFNGGDLYIVYPKEGFTKRTEAQQNIYKQELLNYPTHLFDCPLDCGSIPEALIGATYLFTDRSGETYLFAIKMTQAKDPKEKGEFGLWFGSLQNIEVIKRLNAVLDFALQYGEDKFVAKWLYRKD